MDTADKRSSSMGMVLPFLAILPIPDGLALNQGDRQQTAYSYRGIVAHTPSSREFIVIVDVGTAYPVNVCSGFTVKTTIYTTHTAEAEI